MAYENTGYLAFANALSNAGQQFGEALQQRDKQQKKQQYLMDLAPIAKNSDWNGLAEAAFKYGDVETGVSALSKAAEEKKLREQRALGDATLAPFLGGGAPVGATGGVTPNPNPQPMNLSGALPSKSEMSQYIVEAAKARGIDPGVALRVAGSEGLDGYTGDSSSSFGPFQLHYGGIAKGGNAVPGLGDEFTKATGLDARNPQTWKQQVDFSLDKAKQGGWGPWHGWKGDQWAGLRGGGVQVADASGAVPASAVPGQATQQPQQAPTDGLMARKNNLMQAIIKARAQGVDEKNVKSLEMMLEDTQKQLDRADKQAKPEVKQFGDTIYRVGQDGSLAPVQKVEKSAQEKALTADQSNAAGFADRMDNAEKILSDPALQSSVMGATGIENQGFGKIPVVGAKWQSPEFKRYERAKKDFITATLRKESGASISPSEFANEEVKYFPQPFDDPQTLADKAQARQIAIASMRRASGPAQGQSSVNNSASSTLDEARAAIAAGADRGKVIERLKANGISAAGL